MEATDLHTALLGVSVAIVGIGAFWPKYLKIKWYRALSVLGYGYIAWFGMYYLQFLDTEPTARTWLAKCVGNFALMFATFRFTGLFLPKETA